MAGAPTKLDDIRSKRVCDALANGLSRTAAADVARVGLSTLMLWLAKGRDGIAPYSEFLERVREAEARAEQTIVNALYETAKGGHVGAQCFWLERRRPLEWGKREVTAVDESERAEASGESDTSVLESLLAASKSRKSA